MTNRPTASFLNHFFTSLLTPSYSLSTTFVNLESMSDNASKMAALVCKALANGHIRDLIDFVCYNGIPEMSPVILNPAISRRAFASFFCRTNTAPATSQYSFSILSRFSIDLQDL